MTSLLQARYATALADLVPFYEDAERAVYRVDRRDGPSWVLRLFPASRPLECVRGDAAVLRYLARHNVPAERLVPCNDGESTAIFGDRGVLVTRFIQGTRPDRSPDTLRRLGDALGRLHALLPCPDDNPFLVRHAGSLPREDLAYGRSCLARVSDRVPLGRRSEFETIRDTLDATHDCEDLPHGLTHGDCHLRNALRTRGGRVVLFDWDGAGQGPLLAALGLLLFSCVVQPPDEPPIPPDLSRVDAVVEGYCRHRVPTPAELARLADAVRYRPLVIAARNLAASVEQGQPSDPADWGSRYGEADAVAARARLVVARYLSTRCG